MNPAERAADAVERQMGGGVQHSGGDYRVRCPVHGGEDRHLSIRNGTRGADIVVHCFSHECDPVDILYAIDQAGGREPRDDRRPPPKPAVPTPNNNLGNARTIWHDARPVRGTLVETYLASRDLELPPGDDLHDWMRFHPRLRHPTVVWLPGIVCLVRDPFTNANVGIHRTFLTDQGGKTSLTPDRALLGGGGLGVIKIVNDAEITTRIELVEGIESGLALLTAACRQGYMPPPVWAAVSASAFAKFPVLAAIEVLTLHHDNDEAGRKAAQEVVERWADDAPACEVLTAHNPQGKDWNDR
jgi:putative DNA primase/helicase